MSDDEPEFNQHEPGHIARQIRLFAAHVSNPSEWMIIVPSEEYDAVESLLDTYDDVGTYYEGASLCWSDKHDEVVVKRKTSLSSFLETDVRQDAGGVVTEVEYVHGRAKNDES